MAKLKENNLEYPIIKLVKTIKRHFLQSILGQLGMIFQSQFNKLVFYQVKTPLKNLLVVHLILVIIKPLNEN